jgi:hypothetical protein
MNLTERAQATEDRIQLPEVAIDSLSSFIDKCFAEASTEKSAIIERLLACERQRKGEYEPQLKAQLDAMGAQPIYMMLTDIKCRAADAWIKDVMQNHNESTWALQSTQEPSLPPELTAEITQLVMQEAMMVAQAGIPVENETIEARKAEVQEEATMRSKHIAEDRAKKMENRIIDKLQEGAYKEALGSVIYDFTTYPACFLKGPVLRIEPKMSWGPNFTPVVKNEISIQVDRVSPYDIYPGPAAVSIQDSYLIHRQKLTRKALRNMIDLKGADKENIEELLRQFPNGYKTNQTGDAQHNALNDRLRYANTDGMFEALEYWGPASGIMLKEWGMVMVDGEKVDDYEEYQINAWKVANKVVRVVLNPHPLNQRPYSKASFVEVPGSFWGKALPESMADVQTMCNAAARALAMNMGIASGPQVEVTVDRLAPGSRLTNMTPWKMWQTTADRTGGGQPAIRFSQPDMHAQELLNIFTFFSRMSDEVTGVPNYIYGSTNVSGAGRTASGLSMLMENASKGIKHAILSLDSATSQLVKRIYLHLMMHDPDTSIKGDMSIVAAGAIGAMIREQQEASRLEFMQMTANPIDMQIIGLQGRAHMLREHAKTMFTDVDKIVPDIEKMKAIQAQMEQAQQMAAMGGQPPGAPPTGQPTDPSAPTQLPEGTPPIAMTDDEAQAQNRNLPSPAEALNG